jgi:hypothetical protein
MAHQAAPKHVHDCIAREPAEAKRQNQICSATRLSRPRYSLPFVFLANNHSNHALLSWWNTPGRASHCQCASRAAYRPSYGFNSAHSMLLFPFVCLAVRHSHQAPASLSDSRQCLLSASVVDQGALLVTDTCVCSVDRQHDIQVSTTRSIVPTALRGSSDSNVGSKASLVFKLRYATLAVSWTCLVTLNVCSLLLAVPAASCASTTCKAPVPLGINVASHTINKTRHHK